MYFKTVSASILLVLASVLSGCEKKSEPVAPPTAEEIAAYAEAAFNGNTAQVKAALEAGMPVDQVETNGNSGLMLAAFNGQTETMQVLIDAGAEIDMRDSNGRTALMFASSGPFPSAVKLLLDNGADVNAVDNEEHWSPVMFAAGEGLSPVVDLLLENGADPKMLDIDDESSADFARSRGHTALADRLQKLIDTP